jgi:hypothetical protein
MTLLKPTTRFLWWFSAALWTTIIFLTLPYVPVWQEWTTEHLSKHFILAMAVLILLIVLIATVVRFIRRKSRIGDYIFLAVIVVGYVYSLNRITIIVEQVHFIEYGGLAYLIISALRVDWKNPGQYLNALLLVTLIGVIDEFIQGNLTNRVGELHDVFLNMLSGALALLWFRFCIKPEETSTNWRIVFKFALPIIGLIVLCIGIFNSCISEFGYVIKDSEIGEFYSRFPVDRLRERLPNPEYFRTMILPRLYVEPYNELVRSLKRTITGETLVHIFCRDKHLDRNEFYTAFRENQILEKYFLPYITGTAHQWSDQKKNEVAQSCLGDFDQLYISPVSSQLITAFSETTQWIIIVLLELGIVICWFFLFRHWSQK